MSKEAATRHLLDSISRWGRTPAPGTARSDIEVSPAAARPVTRAAALLVGALAALLLCWAAVPPVHAQIEDTAPGQVQGLTVTPGYGRLAIGWTRMPDATGYKVQWKYGAQTFTDARAIYRESIIDSTLVTTHVITGLVNGNTYTVRMIATKSGASDGLPSDEVSGTPQNIPPAQVQGLNVTPGDTVLTLEWTQVTDATGYKVQWKSGAQSFANAASDDREYTIHFGSANNTTFTGLTNGIAYTVRVIATKRGASDGTPSEEVTGTQAFPSLPELTIEDARATEGAGVVFTVTLSRAATDAVTVAYSTSDDTATGGADYTTVSNRTLTLTAGSTRGTFTIATTPDALAENDETFTVTLSSPSSNAKLGTAQTATGTI